MELKLNSIVRMFVYIGGTVKIEVCMYLTFSQHENDSKKKA